MRRNMWLVLTFLFAVSLVAAQTTDAEKRQAETEKKALELVEQILSEAPSLKLPENRVRIKTMAAGMLWEKDQARARTYFQEAENDLKQMIQALGYEQNNRERKIEAFNQFRNDLLRNLSQLDPQLALDLLRNTKLPEEYKRQYNGGYDPEVQLEAELASRAAGRDPALALKMVEELLQKGYSFQILNLADSLRGNEQSRATAGEIYKKLISKFATDDFLGNVEATNMAERLLQQANGEAMTRARATQANAAKPPVTIIDDQMFRELIEATAKAAAKSTSDRLRTDNANRLKNSLQSMQPAIERLAPAQLATLRQRPTNNQPGAPPSPNTNVFNEYRTLANNPATTNDQLLELARKAAPQEQSGLYQQIAYRALNKGDTEQAKQIIETYVKEPGAKERFEQTRDAMAMTNAMRSGNLEEAKRLIAQIQSPQRKAEQLIGLSYQIAQKDKPAATSLLEEAATLLGNQVETAQEAQTLINLSRAFAPLAPERSFALSDALVAKFNTIIAAASVLDAFEMRNGFEQGEAKVSGTGSMYWLNQFTNNLLFLAGVDFDRAKATAEHFDRLETRLHALAYVASGVLRPRTRSNVGMPMGMWNAPPPPPPPPPAVIRRP